MCRSVEPSAPRAFSASLIASLTSPECINYPGIVRSDVRGEVAARCLGRNTCCGGEGGRWGHRCLVLGVRFTRRSSEYNTVVVASQFTPSSTSAEHEYHLYLVNFALTVREPRVSGYMIGRASAATDILFHKNKATTNVRLLVTASQRPNVLNDQKQFVAPRFSGAKS